MPCSLSFRSLLPRDHNVQGEQPRQKDGQCCWSCDQDPLTWTSWRYTCLFDRFWRVRAGCQAMLLKTVGDDGGRKRGPANDACCSVWCLITWVAAECICQDSRGVPKDHLRDKHRRNILDCWQCRLRYRLWLCQTKPVQRRDRHGITSNCANIKGLGHTEVRSSRPYPRRQVPSSLHARLLQSSDAGSDSTRD